MTEELHELLKEQNRSLDNKFFHIPYEDIQEIDRRLKQLDKIKDAIMQEETKTPDILVYKLQEIFNP